MPICGIYGCSNRPGVQKDFSFFKVPKIITGQGDETLQLSTERRRLWKCAISRKDITTEEKWDRTIVCSKHFVGGIRRASVTEFDSMRLRCNHSYIIYKISRDMKYIEIADLGEPVASYDSFVKKLEDAGNQNEDRYAVFDANIADKKNVLVFFMWIPVNERSILQIMLFNTNKRAIRSKLRGIAMEVQYKDTEDLAWLAPARRNMPDQI